MANNTAMEVNEDLEDDSDVMSDKPSATAQTTTVVDIAGLIIPPPEIKVIVDRTADFVRRVGQSFEAEIVQRHGYGFVLSTFVVPAFGLLFACSQTKQQEVSVLVSYKSLLCVLSTQNQAW